MVTMAVGALSHVGATLAGGNAGTSSNGNGDGGNEAGRIAVIGGGTGNKTESDDLGDDYGGDDYGGRVSVNSTTSQSSGTSQITLDNDHEYDTADDGEYGGDDCDTEDEEAYREYQQKKKDEKKTGHVESKPQRSGQRERPRFPHGTEADETAGVARPTIRAIPMPMPSKYGPRPEANIILPALNLHQWLLWAERLPQGVGSQVWIWHPQMPVRPVFANGTL
jgi:hypothetical protein